MSRYGSLAALASAAALTAGLAACDGGGGSAAGPTAGEIAAGTARVAAISSALEAAKATLAGGRFDDSAHRVAPAGTSGGTVGAGTSGSGSWAGRFHGSDGAESNARPSDVTGRFDVHLPGMNIAGAFGVRNLTMVATRSHSR